MREIDGKFKIVGERIIHISGDEIPKDEPLFLLRGRDNLALQTLKQYLKICKAHNCTEYQMTGIKQAMDSFGKFKRDYPDRMKQPGITRGKQNDSPHKIIPDMA